MSKAFRPLRVDLRRRAGGRAGCLSPPRRKEVRGGQSAHGFHVSVTDDLRQSAFFLSVGGGVDVKCSRLNTD